MGTPAALLSDLHVLVEVDYPVRTGIQTVPLPGALGGIDNDRSIFSLVDGFASTGFHAGSIIAVLTHVMHIAHLDLGDLSSDMLFYSGPELTGIRLRFSNRGPIIADMLIFARNLAVITAITFGNIDDHYFTHFYFSPL
jgi:hypothetical protein